MKDGRNQLWEVSESDEGDYQSSFTTIVLSSASSSLGNKPPRGFLDPHALPHARWILTSIVSPQTVLRPLAIG